jgi:hypothetical protein
MIASRIAEGRAAGISQIRPIVKLSASGCIQLADSVALHLG